MLDTWAYQRLAGFFVVCHNKIEIEPLCPFTAEFRCPFCALLDILRADRRPRSLDSLHKVLQNQRRLKQLV